MKLISYNLRKHRAMGELEGLVEVAARQGPHPLRGQSRVHHDGTV